MKKCIGQHLWKHPKKSQVRGHEKWVKLAGPRSRKMPKTRRYAVTEICQKTSKFVVKKNFKMHRLALMQKSQKLHDHGKCQKLAVLRSRKMPKTYRSAVTENANNSQVRGQGKMPKTRRSEVTEICQKPSMFAVTKR